MKKYAPFVFLFLAVLMFSGCTSQNVDSITKTKDKTMKNTNFSTENENIISQDENISTTSEGVKYLVHPTDLVSGGPPKDDILSIDNPKFISLNRADNWIEDNELVLGLNYSGEKRAYPLQILVWHEIVNDEINGDPILITYCPLCGSGIGFKRKINGEAVEFGVSGKLYNSNLVMYDRKTDSYWTQIGGKAIVGELTGMKLEKIPVQTLSWKNWKNKYPNSKVLSRETGYNRAYGQDPYGNYYNESYLLTPVENEDNRIHPKTSVYGVELNGTYKAYKVSDLKELNTINDSLGSTNLTITYESGEIEVTTDKGKRLIPERQFWFAWYAFHPNTTLYSK